MQCELKELRGDADLIEQLLINLLANAARHSPPDSTTTVQATRDGHNAVLRVIDEGCGIAAEHLPKLGQRFYRVEEGRERTASTSMGSGLGLAICRRIALAHGGTLHIESEVGRGTTVTVALPDYTG
jgi:two-component system phosphate regulon sensor histidine kinase PhoR